MTRLPLIAAALLAASAPLAADYCWRDGTDATISTAPPSGECTAGETLYAGPECWDAVDDTIWRGAWTPEGPRCATGAEVLDAERAACRARLRQAYADRWSDPTLGYSALDVAAAGQYPLPDRLACYAADIAAFDAALSADLSAVAGMDLATARQCAPESLPSARKDEEATQCAE